jgi:hypothetical protein
MTLTGINFRLSKPLIVFGMGVTFIGVYLWAFLHNQIIIIIAQGLLSLCGILLGPILISAFAPAFAIEELKSTTGVKPVRYYIARVTLRFRLLALISALLIPILVTSYLYILIVLYASDLCDSNPCSVIFPGWRNDISSAVTYATMICFGWYGMNLLAHVLGVGLAVAWRNLNLAYIGTWLVLGITAYMMFALPSLDKPIFAAKALLLPYILAFIVVLLTKDRRVYADSAT